MFCDRCGNRRLDDTGPCMEQHDGEPCLGIETVSLEDAVEEFMTWRPWKRNGMWKRKGDTDSVSVDESPKLIRPPISVDDDEGPSKGRQ